MNEKKEWQCPKCNRSFKNVNQNHYCGETPKTVEEYIFRVEEAQRETVLKMRDIIKRVAPNAIEKISWSMPYFVVGKKSVSFSAGKNHISFFVTKEAVEIFDSKLEKEKIKHNCKGTIQLKWDNVPFELVEEITRFCLVE
jgi:uncharacterized protein YdhG (YjbR/CyaY superfamily)